MELRSLTYTSRADGLGADELEAIHRAAMTLNALDGVTGLLVYNGRYFIQVVEGADEAIEDLLGRLGRDPRHREFRVREDRIIEARSFPDWSMALAHVSAGRFEAKADLARALPPTTSEITRATISDLVDRMAA